VTRNLDCFFRGLWLSIRHLANISGHSFVEIYNSEDVQILECEYCGHLSVGWKKNQKEIL
jgi:hypothetical protein